MATTSALSCQPSFSFRYLTASQAVSQGPVTAAAETFKNSRRDRCLSCLCFDLIFPRTFANYADTAAGLQVATVRSGCCRFSRMGHRLCSSTTDLRQIAAAKNPAQTISRKNLLNGVNLPMLEVTRASMVTSR